jgi:hypothetical protein
MIMYEYRDFVAQQRARRVRLVSVGVVVFLVLCIAGVMLVRTFWPSPSELAVDTSTPTPTVLPTFTPVPPAAPTSVPGPTEVVAPTETPTLQPSPTLPPLPEPSPTPVLDAQGDVGIYGSGVLIEGAPGGVDIRSASVDADLRLSLQPGEQAPAELAQWMGGSELLLWVSFYDPIPDPPPVFTDWVFVLDLDGDAATGRPVGTAQINPDLGYEAAIGVTYNDTRGAYERYFLVWDSARSALVLAPDVPQFIVTESRTLIGIALPLETLTQAVQETAGVTFVPEAVRGRTAAQSLAAGQKVIDFYPDRPE